MNKLITFCIFILIIAKNCFCAETGTSTAVFLKMPTGARPAGMGSAFCGISDDVNSLYWNPAGISNIKEIQATATHIQWIEGITNTNFGVVIPFNKNNFGFSVTYVSYGDIEVRSETGELKGKDNVYDMSMSLTYATSIIKENLSLGISGKTITQKYADIIGSGSGFDFSLLYKLSQLSFGLNLQNFGSSVNFEKIKNNLPTNIKFGIGYKFNNILFGFDIDNSNDSGMKFHFGTEVLLKEKYYIRGGYDQIDKNISFNKGLSFGLGMNMSHSSTEEFEEFTEEKSISGNINFDYALITLSDFGLSHRISITIKF